jgi:hypothetical protein
MVVNKLLLALKDKFSGSYTFEFPDKNVARISNDKESLPFAICVIEPAHPGIVIISFTVSFEDATKIADFVVGAMFVTSIEIAEPFYLNEYTGDIYWGREAYENFELNMTFDLNGINPLNKNVH